MPDLPPRATARIRILAPKPSPIRRLIRFCTRTTLVLALLLIITQWCLSRYAAARLDEDFRRYRAAGEPIDPWSFDRVPPPDDQNAAVDLIAAARAIDDSSPAWKHVYQFDPAIPLDPDERAAIDAVLRDSRDALARLEPALAKPYAQLKQQYQRPADDGPLEWSPVSWRLAQLLRMAALRAHNAGDDAAAFRRVRQLLLIARVVEGYPRMTALSDARRVRHEACEIVLQIAPGLRIGDDAAAGDATRPDVRAVIDELTEDHDQSETLIRALQGERVAAWDWPTSYADGRVEMFYPRSWSKGYTLKEHCENAAWRWLLTPIARNDARLGMNHATEVIDAVRAARDWPELSAQMSRLDFPRPADERPWLHVIARMVGTHYERRLQFHFQAITEQHLAATALALRAYALDHNGRYPSDLDALVPRYLPAPPLDSMARAGRRLGYLPAGPVSAPTVYSVGSDGVDDGASREPIHPSRRYRLTNPIADWTTRDVVIDLSPRPRVRPPAAAP